tara:strand:- start:19480 stop:20592 length:1113 start_codon:yes stop_codon:yes gene_type:complete
MAATTMENSSSAYCDPLRAQQEKTLLFQRTPIVACFSSDVGNRGDCFVFDLAGTSILILRGKDLTLRAFLNRCPHRGTRLIATESGPTSIDSRGIRCPFHAWCFDLEGCLTHRPGADGFDAQHKQQRQLTVVAVIEHLGMVYVQLKGQIETEDIEQHLGAFHDEIELLELPLMQRIQSYSLQAESNWKYAMDTYCEGYHFGVLHKDSIGSAFFSNVAVVDEFPPHWRMCFAESNLSALALQDQHLWPDATFSGVHFLFPNTLLVVSALKHGEMCVRMFQLLPGQQPGKMSCLITVYAPGSVRDDDERVAREFAYNDATSDITREDYEIATQGYKNLANAPDEFRLIYGKNEPALQAFHRALTEALSKDPE